MASLKLLCFATLFFISTQFLFAQKTEISFNAYSGFFSFRGTGAANNSAMSSFSYSLPEKYTYKPYGKKSGFSYSFELQCQKVTKKRNVFGIDISFEQLVSEVKIDTITSGGFVYYPPVAATGKTKLTNTFVTLNPFVGHRYLYHKIKVDLLAGFDIAFCLKSEENGTATTDDLHYLTVENNRPKPSIDFRARTQLKAQIKNYGFIAGYSLGLTNYQTGSNQKAYSGFLRLGFSYQLK